jgi:uncharacterized protein (TIGR03435 family)
MAVRVLIGAAWGSDAIQVSSQIVGGPSWIDTDHYDINTKASTGFSEKDGVQNLQRLQAMLRALLEERFHVKVHTEMREVPIFALALANKAKIRHRAMRRPILRGSAAFVVGTATSRTSTSRWEISRGASRMIQS